MAVGNQVDDLPPAALAPAQQLARRVDGVVDVLVLAAAQPDLRAARRAGRACAAVDARPGGHRAGALAGKCLIEVEPLELGQQLIVVGGEVTGRLEDGVEPADSDFVGFAEASGNGSQTAQDLLGGLLLQPIVEQYDCRQGKWVEREDRNLLLDAVLEQAELLLADVRNQPALAVLHRDRHHNHLDSRPDARARVFLLWQGEAGRNEPGREPQRQDFSWTNHACTVSIFPAAAGRLPRTSLRALLAS